MTKRPSIFSPFTSKNNQAKMNEEETEKNLEDIFDKFKLSKLAENINLNDFTIESFAAMSINQLIKNFEIDKENATKIYKAFDSYRNSSLLKFKKAKKEPTTMASTKTISKTNNGFLSKFQDLSNIKYKPGDEWAMDICVAAESASSKAFCKMFSNPTSSTLFGDVNTFQNSNGWTPLMCACAFGRSNLVELMLQKVTNFITKNKDGQTAMMIAASFGHVDVIKILYDACEKHSCIFDDYIRPKQLLNDQDLRGFTPLHYAAYYCQFDALVALLEIGSNPNITDSEGMSPTLIACTEEAQERCLKVLLEYGGNLENRNKKGLNGFQIAGENRESIKRMFNEICKKQAANPSKISFKFYGSF